ncbi:hypothetical protein D3C79_908870 [compost metagenome]
MDRRRSSVGVMAGTKSSLFASNCARVSPQLGVGTRLNCRPERALIKSSRSATKPTN